MNLRAEASDCRSPFNWTHELEPECPSAVARFDSGLLDIAFHNPAADGSDWCRFVEVDLSLRPEIVVARNCVSLLAVCLLVSACRSSLPKSAPVISFNKIPPAGPGGATKVDTIEGRVTRFRPGQQIVVYAKSGGVWWVQPFTDRPFTTIQVDSKWKSQTHLGSEYAALLVDPGYTPSDTFNVLPSAGVGVEAVEVVKGLGPAPPPTPTKTIHFSGYDWTVRSAASFRGGTGNAYDLDNAWTDKDGALHLRIAKREGTWTSAEVELTRALGYGTYVFTVRDISHLEPSAVMTLFTWDDLGTEQNRRELDVEISHWGFPKNQNAHYVVQPYYIPANVVRWDAPAGVLTYSFHWEPGEVTFSTYKGSGTASGRPPINKHIFTSGVPSASGELVHMNLYVFGSGQIPLKNDNEVVIEKFDYLP